MKVFSVHNIWITLQKYLDLVPGLQSVGMIEKQAGVKQGLEEKNERSREPISIVLPSPFLFRILLVTDSIRHHLQFPQIVPNDRGLGTGLSWIWLPRLYTVQSG